MLVVEQWAELRRLHFVDKVSIKELARRFDVDRNTVRRALRSSEPPRYARPSMPSRLDPFKDEIHRLLHDEPRLPNTRVAELIAPLSSRSSISGSRGVRFPSASARPAAAMCWSGRSGKRALALVFSKEAPDLLWGMAAACAPSAVCPRPSSLTARARSTLAGAKPTELYAAFCGQLPVAWRLCAPGDPQAKGVIERLIQFLETSFEPGRQFAGPLDFQEQLDRWSERRASVRLHRALRERPIDRHHEERGALRPLPERIPDVHRHLVVRVPPQRQSPKELADRLLKKSGRVRRPERQGWRNDPTYLPTSHLLDHIDQRTRSS